MGDFSQSVYMLLSLGIKPDYSKRVCRCIIAFSHKDLNYFIQDNELAIAIKYQNFQTVQLLFNDSPPPKDQLDDLLILACTFGSTEIVQILLTNGADPNKLSNEVCYYICISPFCMCVPKHSTLSAEHHYMLLRHLDMPTS